jgi:hypothetical protein
LDHLEGDPPGMNDKAANPLNPLVRSIRSLHGLGSHATRYIARHETLVLCLALTLFGLRALYLDRITPLWFDEFFTLFLSRIRSLPELLQALPSDGQPPLQYLLTSVSIRVFGESEVALRLPELLALLATGFLAYRIVRRHGTATQALFALTILLGSGACKNALAARPYGLLLAFTAAAYLAWQTAASMERRRTLALCGLAFAIAGMILAHHFGVIYAGILLGVGEAARLIERRKPDGWMLAAIAAGLSPLAITVPLARRASAVLGDAVRHSVYFWAKPRLTGLKYYKTTIALPLAAIVCLLILLFLLYGPSREDAEAKPRIPMHEWAAAWALCLVLPAQLFVAKIATGYFLPRYAIGSCLGMALLAAWGLPRLWLVRRSAEPALALSVLAFLLTIAGRQIANQAHQPAWRFHPGQNAVPTALLQAPNDLPIVVASAYDYAPIWWYAPPALQARLTYLADVPYAIRQQDFLPEISLVTGQPYIPIRVSEYAPFLQSHPHFLLYMTGQARLEWVEPRLVGEGWRLTPASPPGERELLLAERSPGAQ